MIFAVSILPHVLRYQLLPEESLTNSQRNLHPNSKDTKEQLLERINANMRTPRA